MKDYFVLELGFNLRSLEMLRTTLLTAVCCAAAWMLSATADASLQITLTAGASSTTIMDGGAGDNDANPNAIQVTTTVGGYQFNLAVASSNEPGSPTLAFVDTSSSSIVDAGGGASIVSILASANGFTSPATPPAVAAFSSMTAQFLSTTPIGNTADVSFVASVGGSQVGTASSSITQPGSSSANLMDDSLIGSLGGTYTISLLLQADLKQAGSSVDLDGQVLLAPIPEPTTIAVWSALGAIGLVAYRRRKTA